MKKWLTKDDLIELYSKIHQRGLGYILSKMTFDANKRTKSTFNKAGYAHANWWIIPELKKRWNKKISHSQDVGYEEYVYKKYLQGKTNLKLLSLGSGSCSHELIFAQQPCFSEVRCVDMSDRLLAKAKQEASDLGLKNMVFEATDVNQLEFQEGAYDMVLFHSSLHHFKNIHGLIGSKVFAAIKNTGLLVINDYVGPNRLQWTKKQLKETNQILQGVVPENRRRRLTTGIVKQKVDGPGWYRMLLTDPSEAVESENILPAIHKHFTPLEEKQLGGNILMLLLKDISHHFLDGSNETKELLTKLFVLEDEFLKLEKSNMVFGVYLKKDET